MANLASFIAMRRVLPKLLMSLVLGGVFAWIVNRGGVPLLPNKQAFTQLKNWAIPAYVAILAFTHLIRAGRWRHLVRPIRQLSFRQVLAINFIGFFAIFTFPLRIGEVVRPAIARLRFGIPMSAGLGTVAVERVVDGLFTSFGVAWALVALTRLPTTDYLASHLPLYAWIAVGVFTTALVVFLVFLWQQNLILTLLDKTIGRIFPRFSLRLSHEAKSLANGMRCIAEPPLLVTFCVETLVYWASNALGTWVLAIGCGLPLEFGHAVAVTCILALGVLLPAGPGMFGNFQLAVSIALKLYVPVTLVGSQGALFIFLLYSLQALVMIGAGIVPLFTMHLSLSRLLSLTPAETSTATSSVPPPNYQPEPAANWSASQRLD